MAPLQSGTHLPIPAVTAPAGPAAREGVDRA
jgi:hypothetical protein